MFDAQAAMYDAMIDWEKRLATESPFYRRVFASVAARRVLDAACGTGQHAAMFRQWGLQVEGADASLAMIEFARANYGQSCDLIWRVRSFDQPVASAEPFDVVICVGNSLALAPDLHTVARAIAALLDAVRDGGIVVLHLLNLWRLPDGPCQWQKCQRMVLQGRETLIIKGVHRSGSHGYVNFIVVPAGDAPQLYSESIKFVGIEASMIEQMVRLAGGTIVNFYGGYQDQPYDQEQSTDLIVVARK